MNNNYSTDWLTTPADMSGMSSAEIRDRLDNLIKASEKAQKMSEAEMREHFRTSATQDDFIEALYSEIADVEDYYNEVLASECADAEIDY